MSEERDALCAALVAESADIMTHRGVWQRSRYHEPGEHERIVEQGARAALMHVATRIGFPALHDQAADVVARGTEVEGP